MRRRDECGALGHERQARRRGLVDVSVEEARVVALALVAEKLEETGRMRTLHREPRLFVGESVRLEEHVALGILERRASRPRHRETANAYRAVHRLAFRKMRRPAPVVES